MDSSRFLSVSRREAEQDGVPVCSSGTVAAGGSLPLHIFIYFLVDGFEHVHFQLGRWSHYLLCHVVSLRDGNHQPVIVEWLSQGWAVVKSTGRMTWRAPPDDPHVRRLQQTLGPKNHLDENISKIGNGRIVVASGMVWSVVLPFWTPPCWDIPSFFNFHRGKNMFSFSFARTCGMCAIHLYLRSGTQTDYHVTVRAQSPATSIRAQLAAPRRGISGGEARCFWARACEAVPIYWSPGHRNLRQGEKK